MSLSPFGGQNVVAHFRCLKHHPIDVPAQVLQADLVALATWTTDAHKEGIHAGSGSVHNQLIRSGLTDTFKQGRTPTTHLGGIGLHI